MSVKFHSLKRPYSQNDKSVPASVRLYNIGAIGGSRAKHEKRFGAIDSTKLPGSDGNPLSTPCFTTIYGGGAYFGHYVVRRAYFENRDDMSWSVTLRDIFNKYATGDSDTYMNTVSEDTGIGVDEPIDFLGAKDDRGPAKLYWVMLAMGRWEANARKETSKGYDAFQKVYLETQDLTDELWYGMRHGVWEAVRDAGYSIEPQETEYSFDANGKPLTKTWIPPQNTSRTPENARVGGVKEHSTTTKGKTKLEEIVEKDAAISGKLSGSRSMLTGGLALLGNWISSSGSKTGLLTENQTVWLTGFVWALVFAFGFFFAMKLLKLWVASREK